VADNVLTEDDDVLEIVEVEALPTPEELAAKETPEEDDKLSDEDDDDEEDTRLSEDDGDDDNPNRKKRQKRRELQKRAKERTERELRMLRDQVAAYENRFKSLEGNAVSHNQMLLDQRLEETKREVTQADQIIAKAIEAGNGEDVAAALRMRDDAKARVDSLANAKKQLESTKTEAPAFGPRAQTYAKQWVDANPWYDPKGSDENSAVTNVIDKRLLAEGYSPDSEEYWNELTSRVSARFGGRKADPETPKKKAPPLGNTREHAPASTRKEVYVTPERKQAMIDAGTWDDPVRRTRMLKAYQDYDRQSAR
jgi:hypothetical protein